MERSRLDADALRTLQRLQARGYEAYLVGGCVRDLLVGRQPKDFDIATGARPQQVKRTFPRNCRIIGRRFKLAHLHFQGGQKILEVSTFRRTPIVGGDSDDLLITRDNEFGSAEEDALRRDFTVNALFLDPLADRIIDYAGGLEDVRQGVIRTIGDPIVRFREDPVRILRAAKFAGRLGFRIDPGSFEAMTAVAPDLVRSAPPRVLEEIQRLLRGGHALDSFQILRDIGAIKVILPVVGHYLEQAPEQERIVFWRMLEALDNKMLQGESLGNAVLLGALFARPVSVRTEAGTNLSPTTVAEELLGPLATSLRLPRRDAGCLKRICGVQKRFVSQKHKRFKTVSFLLDPYFAEALQLFELGCIAAGQGFEDLERWQALAASRRVTAPRAPARAFDEESELPMDLATAGEEEDATVLVGAGSGDDRDGPAPLGGDAPGRRRRRRRRRGRGNRDGGFGESPSDGADDPLPVENDAAEGEGVEPLPYDADTRSESEEEDDVVDTGDTGTEPALDESAAESSPEAASPNGRKRRRRRRRNRNRDGVPEDAAAAAHAPAANAAQQQPRQHHRQQQPPRQQPQGRPQTQQQQQQQRPKAQGKEHGKKGKRGKDRHERREKRAPVKVEVLEPETVDLSAFDRELDPRRAPSFGSVLEGENAKARRRRAARRVLTEEHAEGYKPPPPPVPGEPTTPPPAPRPDTFGDW